METIMTEANELFKVALNLTKDENAEILESTTKHYIAINLTHEENVVLTAVKDFNIITCSRFSTCLAHHGDSIFFNILRYEIFFYF